MNLAASYFLIRISFMNMLAYRSRYYTGIITYTVHVAVHSSILVAAWNQKMVDFSQAELVTFIAIGYIIRSCTFSNMDQEIAAQVADGSMVMDLLKPMDYLGMQFCRATGSMLFRLFIFTGPVGLAIFYFFDNIQLPQNIIPFVISTFLAYWLFAQVTFLVGLCAIKLHSIGGLIRMKNHLLNLLMGLTIPLSFYSHFPLLDTLIRLTPFPEMSHTPVMIYMNRLDDLHAASVYEALQFQFLWALALTLLSRLLWLRVKKHIMIQGG